MNLSRNQIHNLLLKNKSRPGRLEVIKQLADQTILLIYGVLVATDADQEWYGGVSAESFVTQLAQITAPNIVLRINSPGGDMFAGRVMQQAIAEHASNVTVVIDGLCASAATYLPLAADKVIMGEGTFMMIHQAMTMAYGNADDLRSTAGVLDQMDSELVKSYEKKTGQTPEQLLAWVKAETWLSADDCVKYGFADKVSGDDDADGDGGLNDPDGDGDGIANRLAWDLSVYANAPKPVVKTVTMSETDLENLIQQRIAAAKQPEPKPVIKPQNTARPDLDAMRRRLELAQQTA